MLEQSDLDRRSRGLPDSQIFVAIVAVSILALVGLWVISRNAPSAFQQEKVSLQTGPVTGEEGCSNFALFWTVESGVNVPVESISDLTNCRLSPDGAWFVPASATDSRLPESSRLTEQEQVLVAALESDLLADLDALIETVPTSLKDSLLLNFDEDNEPVFGHNKRGRTDLGAKRSRYIRIAQAYLISPDRTTLAEYVGWVMQRRDAAMSQFETSCYAELELQFVWRACDGMRAEFAVAFIPFYWDLSDPVLLQDYLIYRARSGEPLPGTESTVLWRQDEK